MYDFTKPDLIIHETYFEPLQEYSLDLYFNVIRIRDLTISTNITPNIVTNNGIYKMFDAKLHPYFAKNLKKCSGTKPECTTFYFKNDIPIYSIAENGPRYIIWTKNHPLTVCGTHVDRIIPQEFYQAVMRAKAWSRSYEIKYKKSIIVFDLDETLIDSLCKKLDYADELLEIAHDQYDYVVLYSHGSHLHVDDNVTKFKFAKFDLVLSNDENDKKCNKNLLQLYNYFPQVRFTRATLVDDSLYNWTPEYTKLVVPYCTSLKFAFDAIVN